jgi:signal transduction histidine kinase
VSLAPAMLRLSKAEPSRVLEIADRTERSSARATGVVDALLAFSRASRTVEPDEAAGLQETVHAVLEEIGPLVARLDATVELGPLPDVYVRCNPGLLQIVVANLCGNAVKYLDGQSERRVSISARPEGESCRIAIEDTGPGIPREAREKIFEPFFRVEGTRAPGTGIGLATVRRIVDARGGRVNVDSHEGKGSRFEVWLPLAPTPVAELPGRPGDVAPRIQR